VKIHFSPWRLFLIFVLILIQFWVSPPVAADPLTNVEALFETMTTEEKVGQLFLITFDGTEVGPESEIFDLIARYHIGGVVLSSENNNFTSQDTILATHQLIQSLQQIEWDASTIDNQMETGADAATITYIPLFTGLKQIGNGFPGDEILSGLTPYPSQMAIGATWDISLASRVGEVIGRELSALGINLFLGPNLDVLENVNNAAAGSLGVNTFGGDPFWVGEMGKSYISGIHNGSDSKMLVVSQNFPGTGSSDRSPEFEVATVRKSLEQLKQIELAPYFAVTNLGIENPSRTDAVMVSHIRYQGFQGNIRATTKPISFDSNALQQIMSLPQLSVWRENGGLVISDDLGSGAVRRFFDPNGINFDGSQVARSAFLAGNDMLYADNFISTGDPDAYTTLISVIEFFVQKYNEDEVFAQRVDSSVMRILSAKQRIYGDFNIENVIRSSSDLENIGQSQGVTFDVAQNAVTLINPNAQDLDLVFPSAPSRFEDIVIFTDVRTERQCDTCPITTNISSNGLASALIRIYGPDASRQIYQQNLFSHTFSQLSDVLNNLESDVTETVLENLREADWVIFNTLDIDPDYPESRALQRLLDERHDLLADKNVIVFSLDSPAYLDATNISKVTAFYALYSKSLGFLDVAARVLMKELDPPGALPVSLDTVGYDLITITSPNPSQVIGLELVVPERPQQESTQETPLGTATPQPTPMPSFNIGDTLTIRTRTILDHNQNVVPDGTIVRFNFRISGEPGITQQFETTTTSGIAYFNYRIEATGGLEITATSEPAVQSEMLQINISPEGFTSVIQISPTPIITPTPTEAPAATPSATPSITESDDIDVKSYPTLGDWALGVMIIFVGGGIAYLAGYIWWGGMRWGLRSALCSVIGGLIGYTYLDLGGETAKSWLVESGTLFVVEVIIVGLLIGWIGALIWWVRTDGRYPSRKQNL
jgi:beta-N-acetylhexosaminidase